MPGRVIDLDVVGLEHEADDEKEERARYETEVESEVTGYEETALGVLFPILSDVVCYWSKRPELELCTSGIG